MNRNVEETFEDLEYWYPPEGYVYSKAEKKYLRPIAETFAMIDGNAFFTFSQDLPYEHYEQYLPEAYALVQMNGGLEGAAGDASFIRSHKMKEAWKWMITDAIKSVVKPTLFISFFLVGFWIFYAR